ncbi:tyrosine-type recombinase/integrase [Halomicroarcula sp. F27]|uniref:Tyrosine-type recombinase/integrase n=1 Tax=Haloarcula nitratireducens TaxID=2487749 RepID=A0AAW4PG26_9EURY|nr:tyrosine-type recombinase/integrase [Halomicroarcula nitratireducens]
MAQGPVRKLRSERARLERYGADGKLPRETTEALLEWSSALHPEESEATYVTPDGEAKTFAVSTVQTYLRSIRKVAVRAIPDLCSLDPSEFNDAMDAMHTGENPHVKDCGLAKRTLAIAQSAARTFVWYFDIASPAEITVYSEQPKSGHDDSEVFLRRDVQALRQHVDGPRNRALLELLLNTGQRISAIQGLRIRDIDLEHGTFSLNTDREGLKGAARRVNRRPLLGAQWALTNWLEVHPRMSSSVIPITTTRN